MLSTLFDKIVRWIFQEYSSAPMVFTEQLVQSAIFLCSLGLLCFLAVPYWPRCLLRCHSFPSPLLSFCGQPAGNSLSGSDHGVYIDDIICGAPMYADDQALISESPVDLLY